MTKIWVELVWSQHPEDPQYYQAFFSHQKRTWKLLYDTQARQMGLGPAEEGQPSLIMGNGALPIRKCHDMSRANVLAFLEWALPSISVHTIGATNGDS